jgi:predicted SAM-dependent methyltransferase
MSDTYGLRILERRSWKRNFRILFRFLTADTFNYSLLLLKKGKRYTFDSNRYKGLNLGCSSHNPPGWIGISGGLTIWFLNLPKFLLRMVYPFSSRSKKVAFADFYRKVRSTRIVHHDLFFGIPFANNTVPHVFTSHFMEHLTENSARYLLLEANRVLKPGGMIHIVVPALEDEAAKMRKALLALDAGDGMPLQEFVSQPYDEYNDPFSYHRFMYHEASLRGRLLEAGFSDISAVRRGEGKFPDLQELENRGGLILEAYKRVN